MPDDVAQWLEGIGLGQHAKAFADNGIRIDILPHLSDDDLEKLGLNLGDQRRLQLALGILTGTAQKAEETTTQALPEPATTSEAERRQLTVLFSDLVGSTPLSTRFDPEDMRDVLRAYQDACSEVISRYDGFVAKFMGDGVYAYFGYPRAHEDDAERALYAGLEIIDAISALDRDLEVRIGVATGLVVVGDIVGKGAAQEAAITGETPNLAARLQEIARPNSMVIGETSHELAGAFFEYADLGPQDLKGFEAPVRAWRVVRPRRAESRFDAIRRAGVSELVGREEEIEILLRRWERARAVQGQVVLISGEPGIGKSRLVHALEERIRDTPHTPMRLQCSPFHANSALHPMINQLERSAGFGPDDTPEAKLDKLETLLELTGDEIEHVVVLFAALLSIRTGPRYPPPEANPQRLKMQTLNAFAERMMALSRIRPLLLVLEDAHWIDPTTLELMEMIVERTPDESMLAIFTYRPEFAAPWLGRSRVAAMTLNRLEHDESAELVRQVGGARRIGEQVIDQIVQKTDGVPLFVEELTRSFLELVDTDGGGTESVDMAPLAVPATLQDSLEARLDRLGSAKEVAQIGAAIGREFPHTLVAAVSSADEVELDAALDALTTSGLADRRGAPPDATYIFKHALIQDAAYGSLLRTARTKLHARIAEALETGNPETAETQPEILAHHFTEAGRTEPATRYWIDAVGQAFRRGAFVEAIARAKRGIKVAEDLPDSPERARSLAALWAMLAPAVRATKGLGHVDSKVAFERALGVVRQSPGSQATFPILWGLSHINWAQGNFEKARADSQGLLDEAEAAGDSGATLVARNLLSITNYVMGRTEEAFQHASRAVEIFDPDRHSELALRYLLDPGVHAHVQLAFTQFALGHPDRSLQSANDMVRVGRASVHPNGLAFALVWRSLVFMMRGDVEAVLRHHDECLAGAREFPMVLPMTALSHGWALTQRAQAEEGIAQLEASIAAWEGEGNRTFLPLFRLKLIEGLAAHDRAAETLDVADNALHRMDENGEQQFRSPILSVKGDALVALGRTPESERCYIDALDVARGQSAKSWELPAATRLARLWHSQGKTTEARDLLASVYGWFTEGFDTADLKEAKALLDDLS